MVTGLIIGFVVGLFFGWFVVPQPVWLKEWWDKFTNKK